MGVIVLNADTLFGIPNRYAFVQRLESRPRKSLRHHGRDQRLSVQPQPQHVDIFACAHFRFSPGGRA